MNGSMHPEVWLAAGYAAFLACVALILELVARHTQRRAEQYHIAGFKYHHDVDVWECPTGQRLHRHHRDSTERLARYRAPAHICNSCQIKHHCTDSDHGREIIRHSIGWLDSEIGRFHRGMSLALLLLAQLICGIELLRCHSKTEWQLLASILAPLSLCWAKMLAKFRLSRTSRKTDDSQIARAS